MVIYFQCGQGAQQTRDRPSLHRELRVLAHFAASTNCYVNKRPNLQDQFLLRNQSISSHNAATHKDQSQLTAVGPDGRPPHLRSKMSSSPSVLPTPRQLLTSILNQISGIPAPTAPGRGDGPAQGSSTTIVRTDSFPERAGQPPSNPLRLIEPRHRPLFTTLHVLFPSLLLPALDLLDRGLVTRLVSPEEATTTMPVEVGPLTHQQDEGPDETREEDGGGSNARVHAGAPAPSPLSVYIVRSAQKPTRRPHGGDASTAPVTTTTGNGGGSSSQRTYVVHTAAWNCTCAAFAFSAFPPLSGPSLLAPAESRTEDTMPAVTMISDDDDDDDDSTEHREGGEGGRTWQFGGLSFDGCTDTGGVPSCCKHLLACVLAERWKCGLARYVSRWEVGREEMAGVFADV